MTPELAITNNVALYCAIFRAHGLASRLDEHCWSTDAEPPPYYSRLVTRARGSLARQAQLSRLAELAGRARGKSWSCKDSFDELPEGVMPGLGLRVLFRAWWYGWARGNVTPETEPDLLARRVTTPEALLAWEDAWRRSSPASLARVFPDTILGDTSAELFAVDWRGRMVGGFILNRSEAAVGLSNVFQVEGFEIDAGTFLRECARQARCLHADRALVGYGPRSEVDALGSLGIVPLGPLTVWVSP